MANPSFDAGESEGNKKLDDIPQPQEQINSTIHSLQHESLGVKESDQALHHATPDRSLSAPTQVAPAIQNQYIVNQVHSNPPNQTASSNNLNESLNASLEHANSYNFYYDPSLYYANPSDPLLSYQKSLIEHYQQQQLQHSYYPYPSHFEFYYDQLQQQQLNYPTSSSNSLPFDPFSNFDPSQQAQVQSYHPFPYAPGAIQQPESLSNNNPSTPFFYDEVPLSQDVIHCSQLAQHLVIPDYEYGTHSREVIGTSYDNKVLHPLAIRRCFNCGDSSHSLIGCPEPRNEPLIRLTKQIFQAQAKNDDDQDDNLNPQEENRSRVKESLNDNNLQDSIDRRKLLATMFSPGHVSNTLREALFWEKNSGLPDENYLDPSRPMPWFQSMEKWGYPPSYAIDPKTRDPFQLVIERFNELETDKAWDAVEILEMHEERRSEDDSDSQDTDEEEEEILKMLVPGYKERARQMIPLPPPGNSNNLENLSFPDLNSLPPIPDTPVPLKRLVQYKGGNFSSDRLPIYNGQPISTRSYLDQYSNTNTNSKHHYHHFSNRQSDVHLSQNSPRRSLSSSPSSKARWSPYSNSRAKKEGEAMGKASTQRWKDAALTFAATQQKTHPPLNTTTTNTTNLPNHKVGKSKVGSRNKFYVDPDAPYSNQERLILTNEELNYSDDYKRDECLDYSSHEIIQKKNNYSDDLSSKRRKNSCNGHVRSYHNDYHSGMGGNHPPSRNRPRNRNRNRNLNRAQVHYYEERNKVGDGNKNNKEGRRRRSQEEEEVEEGEVDEGEERLQRKIGQKESSAEKSRTMTKMSGNEINERNISNAYQEEDDDHNQLNRQDDQLNLERKHLIHNYLDGDVNDKKHDNYFDPSFIQNPLDFSLEDVSTPPPLPNSPPPDAPDPPPPDS